MRSKLKLRYAPDDVLRKPTEKIKRFDRQLKKLADDMRELCLKKDGVGLAAPQIGLSIKLIVCYDPDTVKFLALCNPEVVNQEGKQVCQEGCLSFPDQWIQVTRPEKIVVKYHDINGVSKILKAKGLLAEIICHETEHLNNVLLCDSQEKKFSGE